MLSLDFFKIKGFRAGNGAAFFSSFAIFSLFAFSPLYIQGALGKTPMQLGTVMLILSLGWSIGALVCGQTVHFLRKKPAALLGSALLALSCGLTLTFSTATSLFTCSVVLGVAGVGMGFTNIATLLVVQDSLDAANLGIATSSHQFARSLGGTVGIGITGSFLTARLSDATSALMNSGMAEKIQSSVSAELSHNFENFFRPEIQALLSADVQRLLQESVVQGVMVVFGIVSAASLLCFYCCAVLPKPKRSGARAENSA
jgi:Na+/melibiose symporter-like transporter